MAKTAAKLTELIREGDPIVKYEGEGERILRENSKPVAQFTEDIAELVSRMETIMRDANGVGLAAPQLGILKRIFVYDAGDGFHAIINPKILQRKGEQLGVEGCLSIPGLYGDVLRANEVVVKGMDQYGNPVRLREEGLGARVIQHEFDHLEGILFIDRADPDSLRWGRGEEEGDDEDEDEGEPPSTRE
ncbi:peptide deformylase [Capsulimonas corticalis]|uniref:Peptide deformylase n=1 Tax=Capsulimonas corticalis TaxID=2219043 RepID=A0A402CYF0_9BACT|nr:peptide deformylase [Capsulimonas corticalis]BDI31384.1 peptide deformylase [Capsulimonas corticalis]